MTLIHLKSSPRRAWRSLPRRSPAHAGVALAVVVLSVVAPSLRASSVTAKPRPVAAARPPTVAVAVAPLPPLATLARWQPLRGDPAAVALQRPELRVAMSAYRGRRWARACHAVARALDVVEARAARLFYAPVRKDADLAGIDRFLRRYVRGKAPLLEVAGEVFVPGAQLRAMAVDSCVRAAQPAVADRFLAYAALSQTGARAQRLRTSLAIIRWQRTGRLPSWLVAGAAGGARAWLLRAVGSPRSRKTKLIARALAVALPREITDVRSLATWLERRP